MRGVNKYIVVLLSAIFAVGAIVIGMKYSSSKIPKDPTINSSVAEKSTQLTVNDLFSDQNHVFLAEDITDSYIDKVRETTDESNTEALTLLNTASQKWAIQKQLNQLFTAPALVGSRIVDNPTLADGVTEADKQEVLAAVADSGLADGFTEAIQTILGSSGTGASGLGGGSSSVASEKLALLFTSSGGVNPELQIDDYNSARDEIASLPAGAERDRLVSQLRVVESTLTAWGSSFEPLAANY